MARFPPHLAMRRGAARAEDRPNCSSTARFTSPDEVKGDQFSHQQLNDGDQFNQGVSTVASRRQFANNSHFQKWMETFRIPATGGTSFGPLSPAS
ncbi:hypothetical protein [Bradyrhizobium sp. SZCCHNS3002]|uniref:hypothetical protein n=1 Tax=Bradyrhizobium sp. SZCCHNS3002 TaxID=3057310 RepID=UPI0028EFAD79|nr:hypothetical protein [Bradyrhizobium sp. SZCCHNS3002]